MDGSTGGARGMLANLKVLDLSRLVPGPYASLVLADLGARVDKLEDPDGGDYLRHAGPRFEDGSAYFYALNRNKRSLALDLKSPEGVAALRRLVRGYDVLLESFRPGVMEKLGLSWSTLSAENPRLVYCALSGFGQDGPDRARSGHDIGYAARAGVLGYGGAPQGAPALPGAQIADIGGALFAVVGILAALHERARTGRGRLVDVSMTESAMAFVHMHLAAQALAPTEARLRRGSDLLNGGAACYGVYQTKDHRYLAVGALEPQFLEAFCAAIERPELAAVAWDTGEKGARARKEIERTLRKRTRADWLEHFREVDACVEPVWEGGEIEADPQHVAREVFVSGGVKNLRTPLAPRDLSPARPPSLGEHSEEILREGGFDSQEIAALLRHSAAR